MERTVQLMGEKCLSVYTKYYIYTYILLYCSYVHAIVFTKLRYARRLLHTKLIILHIACDAFIHNICIE